MNEQIRQERGSGEAFDGTIEFWWDNASELVERYDSPAAQQLRQELLEYQMQFIDVKKCHAFFTEFEEKKFS